MSYYGTTREREGVAKSRVNMWENGGTVPRQDVLLRLSQFFGVSTDDLLGNIRTEGDNATMHSLQRNLKKLNGDLSCGESVVEEVE